MKTRKLRKIKGKKMRGGKTERSGGFGCLFAKANRVVKIWSLNY